MTISITDLVAQAKSNMEMCRKNPAALKKGIKECNQHVRKLISLIRNSKVVGEKMHLLNALGLVKGYRKKMKCIQLGGLNNVRNNIRTRDRIYWNDLNSAFKGRIHTAVITNLMHTDPKLFLEDCSDTFIRKIRNILKKEMSLKINTVFCGEYEIPHKTSEKPDLKYINTKNIAVFRDTDLKLWYAEHVQKKILNDLEDFQGKNSGWSLTSIINLAVHINKYTPLIRSSYIELPKQIEDKKACINVKNNDNACFAWAVMSALYPVKKDPHE